MNTGALTFILDVDASVTELDAEKEDEFDEDDDEDDEAFFSYV